MNHPLFCPICHAPMRGMGRCPTVTTTGGREYYLGLVVACQTCAAVTELDPENGDLLEFPRWRLANLVVPYNGMQLPISSATLGRSMLYEGVES